MNETHIVAGRALKTMFIGELLAIIGAVLGLIPLVNVVGGILTLAGAIVALVGLVKARPAHEGYRKAVTMIIVMVIVSVISTILATVAIVSASAGMVVVIALLLPIVISIVGFLQVYYVCTATSQLMREAGNEAGAAKGDMVWKLNALCYLLTIVFTVISFFAVTLAGVGGIITGLIGIVASVVYLLMLNDGAKTLGG